ncbi:MAG: glycosyltransferase family 39 protein [Chloroflexi bacterium]|nr:glycosyltransferase family 39 protein [Chloroflexota bacterium]
MPRRRVGPILLFLLPLLVYLALTLYQIDLPGPNYDEAVEAKAAVQLVRGLPVEAHRDSTLTLWGKRFPLMIVDYVGALNTYGLLVLFELGGVSVAAMRLWPLLIGALILWLTYRLAWEVAGLRVGLIVALLLAVHPSFIFFSRQGIYVTNTTVAFSLAILLALWQLLKTGRMRWWYLLVFLAGFGLWAKFIMLWPLLATAVLAPLVWIFRRHFGLEPAEGFGPRQLIRPGALVLALLLFLIGLSPFLLFNWQTGATFDHFLGTLSQSYYGIENTNYLENLAIRWGQIGDYLKGNHFWYLGGSYIDLLAYPAWLLGFVIALALLLLRRRDPHVRAGAMRSLFFYAYFALILLQTPLTPTALWYTHLAFFSPVLALGIATSWDLLFRQFRPHLATTLAVVFVTALGLSSLRADIDYHQSLAASGGYADHSDASYRLSEVLAAGGISQPYALDWGFDAPLILVSGGDINPIEIFGYDRFDAPDDGFSDRIRPLLKDSDSVFLLHALDRTNFPGRREALEVIAIEEGIQLETIATIRERSGAPHTEIVRPLLP